MKPKFVAVTWLDACAGQGYYRADKTIGILHESVGHLVRNDKKGVVIGMTYVKDGTGDVRIYSEIPRAYIKKIKYLR